MNIFLTFIDKKSELLKAIIEHFQISLLSLIIAILIAFTIGIVTFKYKK